MATTQTDEQGRYRFEGFDLGRYRVRVVAGIASATSGPIAASRGGDIDRIDVAVTATQPDDRGPGRRVPGRPSPRTVAFAALAADTASEPVRGTTWRRSGAT